MTDKVVGMRQAESYGTPNMLAMADELRAAIREIEAGRCAGVAVVYVVERTPADVYVHRRYAYEARKMTFAGGVAAINQAILGDVNDN